MYTIYTDNTLLLEYINTFYIYIYTHYTQTDIHYIHTQPPGTNIIYTPGIYLFTHYLYYIHITYPPPPGIYLTIIRLRRSE